MKKKKGGHTGKIHHPDMKSYHTAGGGKDPHASREFHAANAEHDMPHGMTHDNAEDEEGPEGENEECC